MGSINLTIQHPRIPASNSKIRNELIAKREHLKKRLRVFSFLAPILSHPIPKPDHKLHGVFITGYRKLHPELQSVCKERNLPLIGNLLQMYDVGSLEVSTENAGQLIQEIAVFIHGLHALKEHSEHQHAVDGAIHNLELCKSWLHEYVDQDLIRAWIF